MPRYLVALFLPGLLAMSSPAHSRFLELVGVFENPPLSQDVAFASAMSPDGRHLYVSGYEGTLVVFEHDAESGELGLVDAYVDGVDGVHGLDFAAAVAVSPDGRHVYVGAGAEIVAFERRVADGTLRFAGVTPIDVPFGQVVALAFAAPGRQLYAGLEDNALAVFRRDAGTGALAPLQLFDEVMPPPLRNTLRPAALFPSPDERYVYLVFGSGAIVVFERDGTDGTLRRIEVYRDDEELDGLYLGGVSSAVISADGRFVYLKSPFLLIERRSREGILVLARDPESGRLSVHAFHPEGGLFSTSFLALSPDGRYLYGALGLGVAVWELDTAEGHAALVEIQPGVRGEEEVFPPLGHIVVSPDGRHVYGILEQITAFARPEGPCVPGAGAHCLNANRFRVDVEWRDFQGQTGTGRVMPFSSDDSGLFYFFGEDNWELLVKVLDGCELNDRYWVFAAATTNVEYSLRVIDAATGATRTYFNPLGTAAAAVTDANAFATCGDPVSIPRADVRPPAPATSAVGAAGSLPSRGFPNACEPGATTLCLQRLRFRVEVGWRDFGGDRGIAQVVPFVPFNSVLTEKQDSGLFWFFGADNWELLVKVLDGCALNGRFWLFAAATTNVEHTLRLTDTWSGEVKEYHNSLGSAAVAITDTGALATCDAVEPHGSTKAGDAVRAPAAGTWRW